MTSPAAAPSGETAARILDAADELFSDRGFDAVSVRDIAERAGVNKGLVFYYFESKAALFERVLERYYEAHAEALAVPLTEGRSLLGQLHALLDAYLDFVEENQRYVRLVTREVASRSERVALVRHGLASLYDRVSEIMGAAAPDSGPLAPKQFFVSIAGLVSTYYLYAEALGEMWDGDPMSVAQRRERREHLHWIVQTLSLGLAEERQQLPG